MSATPVPFYRSSLKIKHVEFLCASLFLNYYIKFLVYIIDLFVFLFLLAAFAPAKVLGTLHILLVTA